MEKQDFNDLINKAKSSNQSKTIQKITPLKEKTINNEVQFSFYIEKKTLKKVKQKALDKDVSIKNIINEAINKYIN